MVTSTNIIDYQKTFLVFIWLIKQSNGEQLAILLLHDFIMT